MSRAASGSARLHLITPAGRAEPGRWLDEPSQRTRGGYRDDFFLKVMAAAQAGDVAALARVIRRQRRHLLNELRSLTRRTATPHLQWSHCS